MKTCEKLAPLREAIRQSEAESRYICMQIRESSGLDRHTYRLNKRSQGRKTRYKLLAYSFLRGRPYKLQERKTSSLPSFYDLIGAIRQFGGCVNGNPVDGSHITAWINGEKIEGIEIVPKQQVTEVKEPISIKTPESLFRRFVSKFLHTVGVSDG